VASDGYVEKFIFVRCHFFTTSGFHGCVRGLPDDRIVATKYIFNVATVYRDAASATLFAALL
jgi:hypothetical protein